MLICSRKLFLLIIVIVSLKNPAFCQLVLNSPNSSGYHIAPTTITLSAGFSTAPGQVFSAKINSTPTVQLSNQNYVLETIVKQSGSTISDDLPYQDYNVAMRSVQYFDGLGRPMQNISINGNNNGTKDLISPIGYDGFGREANKYLAYATQGNFGSYRVDALNPSSGVFAFYNAPSQNIAATSYPYAFTKFENNPLGKVIEQGAVGATWQPDPNNSTGHTLKNTYLTNTDQNGSRPVKHYMAKFGYTYNGNPINQYDLAEIGFYNKNELSVVINYGENWVASDAQAGTTEEYKDRLGNVILKRQYNKKPNNSIETLSTYYVYDGYGHLTFVLPPGTMPDNGNISTANLNDFAYQYRYDGKERLIEKKVPGKGWEYMVYNKRDQVTYHKDSKQAANAEWSWNKYDGLGRVIATGIEIGKAADRQTIQNLFDAHSGQNFESRTSATVEGYTIDTYPMAGDLNPNIDYHTINYYDDYDFPGYSSIYAPTLTVSTKTKGLITASKTRILGTSNFLLSVMYYDDEGRIIETIADNYLQGTDRIVNIYDFAGQLLSSTRTHIANGVTTLIAERSEYDHMGRKIRSYQKIGDATSTEVLLSESSYNDIGQLVSKKLHNGLKENTYSYNERGWLKTSTTPSLFAMELKYQDGPVPQYNGNISAQNWSTDAGAQKSYAYSYDNLSRLLSGISGQGKNEILTYDIMGNISSLIRDSGTPQAYYYLGNRLQSVTGGASRNFTYDENGSVVTDGTNTFTYNYLSLLQTVTGPNAAVYTYDASGRKLSRTAGGVTTYYVDGIQYTGTVIDFIQTEEGIARRNTATQYLYQYNLTDHLGNVRYTFDGTGGKLQADDYYPFGKTYNSFVSGAKNTYLYNGKDLQEGLEQYDYGARFYDPVIARWNVIDPLAEKVQSVNPYGYTDNNPVNNIDPNGMETLYGADAQYAFKQLQNQVYFQQGDPKNDKKNKNTETNVPLSKSEQLAIGLRYYCGDYSGSAWDLTNYYADQFNQFVNPIASFLNVITGTSDNKDWLGNPQSKTETAGNAVAIIPFGRIATLTAKLTGKVELAIIRQGITKTLSNANTIEHIIYGSRKLGHSHNLGFLLKKAGSEGNVIKRLYLSLGQQAALPAQGTFQSIITIYGKQVTIRGAVVDGIPRISNAFAK